MCPRRFFVVVADVRQDESDVRRGQIIQRRQNNFPVKKIFIDQCSEKIAQFVQRAPKISKRLITEDNTIIALGTVRIQNGLADNYVNRQFVKLRRIERQ